MADDEHLDAQAHDTSNTPDASDAHVIPDSSGAGDEDVAYAAYDDAVGEQPEKPVDPYEGAVPPGYDWPTHGGYLGCLLAQMPACLVGGFLGSTLFNVLNVARIVPGFVAGILTVLTFIAGMILFGRVGWLLGRRFYRAYPQPVPSWGENDATPVVAEQADESTI